MPSLAWRGNRLGRRRREATPNSGAAAHAKEPQKVTPWKNYLAETKAPTRFFARPGVSPCHGENFPPTNACFWPNGWLFVLTGPAAKNNVPSGSFGNRSAALASRRNNEVGFENLNERAAGTIDGVFAAT